MVEDFDNWYFYKVSIINTLRGVFFVLRIPNNFNTSNGEITATPPSPGRPTLHSTKTSFGTVQRYKGEALNPFPPPVRTRTLVHHRVPPPLRVVKNLPTSQPFFFVHAFYYYCDQSFLKWKFTFALRKDSPTTRRGGGSNLTVYLLVITYKYTWGFLGLSLTRPSFAQSFVGGHSPPKPRTGLHRFNVKTLHSCTGGI